MLETPEQWLVMITGRCARQFGDRYITAQEFTNKLLDTFADSERMYPDIIPRMWELIPESVQAEFVSALRAAVLPDFSYHAFEMGGGRGLTEEERRYQQLRNAERVREWADEFLLFLDSKKIDVQ